MKLIFLLLSAVILNGCACQLTPLEKAGKEWVTQYPSNFNGIPIEFKEVTENTIKAAIEELKEAPIIQITPEKVQSYTGVKLSEPTNGKYFLVRAVHGYFSSGEYTVTYDGKSLFVHHQSLGSCMLYYQRALVLILPSKPNQVFIGVNVAS